MNDIVQNNDVGVTVATGECCYFTKDTSDVFSYQPDEWQKHAFAKVSLHEDVMVTAHTASGKTSVAIWAIHEALLNNKRIIYTSPIKTLSNQINNDLCKKFGKDNVGIITGDIVNNPSAPILIMTTEILMHALVQSRMDVVNDDVDVVNHVDDVEVDVSQELNVSNDTDDALVNDTNSNASIEQSSTESKTKLFQSLHQLLDNVTTVVFDEVHYINNKERGQVWEKSIMMLPRDINAVMLSATIANAKDFCHWLHSIRATNVTLVPTKRRVVPLEHYIYINSDSVYKIVNKNNVFDRHAYNKAVMQRRDVAKDDNRHFQPANLINEYIDHLSYEGLLPAIIFVLSKKNCEKYASSAPTLIDHTVASEITRQFHSLTARYRHLYETVPQYYSILKNLQRGVGVHHAGMIPVLKETVEILFQQGLLKVLFVTETFAVGVNMPAKVATFTGLEKYCDDGFRYLTTDEYKQMAGRAGRRGLDTIGISILLPLREPLPSGDLESIMVGECSNVKSQFGFNYQFILNTLLVTAPMAPMAPMASTASTAPTAPMASMSTAIETSFDEAVGKVVAFTEKSLLNRELTASKIVMEKQHNSIDVNAPFATDVMEALARYHDIVEKIKQGGLRKKHFVKLQKQQASMEASMEANFKLTNHYKIYVEHLEKCKQAQHYRDAETAQDTYLKNRAAQSIQYLVKQEYLDQQCRPTLRGIIAGNVHECNEIILTEIMLMMIQHANQDVSIDASIDAVVDAVVDDSKKKATIMDFEIIIAILAMMIPSNQEEMTMEDLMVPSTVREYISQVDWAIQSMEKDEFDAGIVLNNDWNLYIGFVNQAYQWAQGTPIKDILAMTPMMEGDFIKNIIRLNSIVGQLARVCELTKQSTLLKALEGAEQKLIRDFVTMDSLYV